MSILITGFEPFGEVKINSSMRLVEAIREYEFGEKIFAEILPTKFEEAGQKISSLIKDLSPKLALSFGMAPKSTMIKLERVALNLADTDEPDNAGKALEEKKLCPGAPTAYISNLPLAQIKKALLKMGIPVDISNTAGTYVCNTAMYHALHTIEKENLPTLYGFIHVPSLPEEITIQKSRNQGASMTLPMMVHAARIIIDHVMDGRWAFLKAIVEGEGIKLRPMEREDAAQFLSHFLHEPSLLKDYVDDFKHRLSWWKPEESKTGDLKYSILSSGSRLIGEINLYDLSHDKKSVAMDIMILPEHQGKGWGTKAMKTFCEFLSTQGLLDEIRLNLAQAIKIGINFLEKNGFTVSKEGNYYSLILSKPQA